jgi:hypothetical protein
MNSARAFMRREDYQPPQTPSESPFRKFDVKCLACGSYQLRLVAQMDEEAGENGRGVRLQSLSATGNPAGELFSSRLSACGSANGKVKRRRRDGGNGAGAERPSRKCRRKARRSFGIKNAARDERAFCGTEPAWS